MLSVAPAPSECHPSPLARSGRLSQAGFESGRASSIGMDLFDFLGGAQSPQPPGGFTSLAGIPAGFPSSSGVMHVTIDDIAQLEATLFYGSDTSTEHEETPSIFRTPTLLDAGLREDHFFGSFSIASYNRAASRASSGRASASAFLNPNRNPPPITSSPKPSAVLPVAVRRGPLHTTERGAASSSSSNNKRRAATMNPPPGGRSRAGSGSSTAAPVIPKRIKRDTVAPKSKRECVIPMPARVTTLTSNPPVLSNLAAKLLPKVDKPELGDLNGKMPRPNIVNMAPRRRRKGDTVSARELQEEDELRKMKSVQSARDCRKRKKHYITGLQTAIAQYDEREAVAQKLISTLRAQIYKFKCAS